MTYSAVSIVGQGPAYNTAIETLKTKIASQLAHYITNINSPHTQTHNNAIAKEVLRKAALTVSKIGEFVVCSKDMTSLSTLILYNTSSPQQHSEHQQHPEH